MSRGQNYTPPKPADRTIRVWSEERDATNEDPALWSWPWDVRWTAGRWVASNRGPNSTTPGLVEGGVGHANPHSTADYARA